MDRDPSLIRLDHGKLSGILQALGSRSDDGRKFSWMDTPLVKEAPSVDVVEVRWNDHGDQ